MASSSHLRPSAVISTLLLFSFAVSVMHAQVATLAGGGAFVPQRGVVVNDTTRGDEIYFADSVTHTIRKVNVDSGAVTTVAGKAYAAGLVNGVAGATRFNAPQGVCWDGTNIFVADTGNHVIRKITLSTSTVTTYTGGLAVAGTDDAQSDPLKAKFNAPTDCAFLTRALNANFDDMDMYVADSGSNRIRRINSTGYVSTIAGDSSSQIAGDTDGSSATFRIPSGLCVANHDARAAVLYVVDSGNHKIRRVTVTVASDLTASATTSTLAGPAFSESGFSDGINAAALFNGPTDCVGGNALDEIYIADRGNSRVRLVKAGATSTVSGNSFASPNASIASVLWSPYGIVAPTTATPSTRPTTLFLLDDRAGNVRRVVIATRDGGVVVAGADMPNPGVPTYAQCVESVPWTIFCTDRFQHVVRRIQGGQSTVFAGSVGVAGALDVAAGTSGNADPTLATFNAPSGITAITTFLFVGELATGSIRRIDSLLGPVTTLVSSDATVVCGSVVGLAVGVNVLYVACDGARLIRITSPTAGRDSVTFSNFAGYETPLVALPLKPTASPAPAATSSTTNIASAAAMYNVQGLCLGHFGAVGDTLWVVETNRILGISLASTGFAGAVGQIGVYVGTATAGDTVSVTNGIQLNGPVSCFAGANAASLLFVVEGAANRIRGFLQDKTAASDRVISVQLGGGTNVGTVSGDVVGKSTGDVDGSVLRFNAPGYAFASSTATFALVDGGNAKLKTLTVPTNRLSTVADGFGRVTSARTLTMCCYYSPGVTYCADNSGTAPAIRRVRRSGGVAIVTFVAGDQTATGTTDGQGTAAKFNGNIASIACDDGSGIIWVSDGQTGILRKVATSGVVTSQTVGPNAANQILTTLRRGNNQGLYIADPTADTGTIQRVGLDGTGDATTVFAPGTGNFVTGEISATNGGGTDSKIGTILGMCPGRQGTVDQDVIFVITDSRIATIGLKGTLSGVGGVAAGNIVLYVGTGTVTSDTGVATLKGSNLPIKATGACTTENNGIGIASDVLYVAESKRIMSLALRAADADRGQNRVWGLLDGAVATADPCGSATTLSATVDTFKNSPGSLWMDPINVALNVADSFRTVKTINGFGVCRRDTGTYTDAGVGNYNCDVDPPRVTGGSAVPGFADTNSSVGVDAMFSTPTGIAQIGGDFYIADTGNHVLRKLNFFNNVTTGSGATTVSTVAGKVGSPGDVTTGAGTAQRFNRPTWMISNGVDTIFLSDTGNHKIKRLIIRTTDGLVTTNVFAGPGAGTVTSGDSAQTFLAPTGLARAGSFIFVSDSGNHKIKRLLGPTATVSHGPAFGIVVPGTTDSLTNGSLCRFNNPQGLAVNDTWLLIADKGNHKIRRCNQTSGCATLVGARVGPSTASSVDGIATDGTARVNAPNAVRLDQVGNVFISEATRIRKLSADLSTVTTVAGGDVAAYADQSDAVAFFIARFSNPMDLLSPSFDAQRLFIVDSANHRVRTIRGVVGTKVTVTFTTVTNTTTVTLTNTTLVNITTAALTAPPTTALRPLLIVSVIVTLGGDWSAFFYEDGLKESVRSRLDRSVKSDLGTYFRVPPSDVSILKYIQGSLIVTAEVSTRDVATAAAVTQLAGTVTDAAFRSTKTVFAANGGVGNLTVDASEGAAVDLADTAPPADLEFSLSGSLGVSILSVCWACVLLWGALVAVW